MDEFVQIFMQMARKLHSRIQDGATTDFFEILEKKSKVLVLPILLHLILIYENKSICHYPLTLSGQIHFSSKKTSCKDTRWSFF